MMDGMDMDMNMDRGVMIMAWHGMMFSLAAELGAVHGTVGLVFTFSARKRRKGLSASFSGNDMAYSKKKISCSSNSK
jgi:hypothetical protein